MTSIILSPAQQVAHDRALSLLKEKNLVGLVIRNGNGRSAVLRQLARTLNGRFLRLGDFFERIQTFEPFQIEEGILRTFAEELDGHDTLLVDDFEILSGLVSNCFYKARPSVLPPAFDALLRLVEDSDKRVVFGISRDQLPDPLHYASLYAHQPRFTPDDFRHLLHAMAGHAVEKIDFKRVHRFIPKLTARQMQFAGELVRERTPLETEAFLDLLEKHALFSNVNTDDVEPVTLDRLKGVDDVIRQMDVDIIVPMERPDLVESLGLRPKRGVLLYGPPGTGKTTIGRALAHRLRSKFFLIDGTVISGTQDFYQVINRIFTAAKENAPSIIFIDDCDVLFENEENTGLYRYLLTMLDGLESKDNSQVTVMLTAMNIGSLPPALIRSGRVELWLEMRLPNVEARADIIRERLLETPAHLATLDVALLAEMTDGMTGADLRRIVADAVNLYGYDIAREKPQRTAAQYFERAVELLKKHRGQLESAPRFTAAHHGVASRRH